MDLSNLSATFDAHRAPILAAAGAGVVGLALYRKKTTAAKPAAGTTGIAASAGGQTAATTGGAAYDSSASDLYGAIQPQLESLGGQLTALQSLYGTTPPTPVPGATAAPASAGSTATTPTFPGTNTPIPISNPSSNTARGTLYTSLTATGNPAGTAAGGTWTPNGSGGWSYYNPATPTGGYVNAAGGVTTTRADQPNEVAAWSKGADGLVHNQWGQTASGLNAAGNPVF